MNSIKVAFGVIFLVFCYINLADSLKCYYCTTRSSCQYDPPLYTCNQTLAGYTTTYLSQHYQNVTESSTGRYQCLLDEFGNSTLETNYRGCIDASINACNLTAQNTNSTWRRSCFQCDSSDGCNPAVRAEISYLAIVLSIVVAYFFKN